MNILYQFLKKNYYLLTALLMFLSFPSYDYFFLKIFPVAAWFCMVPLFAYVSDKPFKEVFFSTFITGLLGHLLAYGWIGNFGARVPGGYFVVLIFLIPSLTAFFSIKVTAAEFLSRKYPRYRIYIYSSVWIIIDFIQSLGFLAFPWTYIGYSQYPFTSFIQIASITGILGVNFIMILFNSSFSDYLLSFRNTRFSMKDAVSFSRFSGVATVILLAAVITLSGAYRLTGNKDTGDGKTLRVSIVQSCISPWENWSANKFKYLSELMALTKDSFVYNPEFVIWSESATLELLSFRAMNGDRELFDQKLYDFVKDGGVPLLTGEVGITVKKRKNYLGYYPQNNAVLISGNGEVVQTASKLILVPFGEWFPYEKWLVPVKNLIDSFGASAFVPGDRPTLFSIKGMKFGSLICYEGIFYRLCREYRNMGADFLVNITNDGWTDTFNGHYQHYSASIFRAVENGIWTVRAGNTGVSAIIDPMGRVSGSVPILKKTFLAGEIDISRNKKTFYSEYGDLVLYGAVFFILIILLRFFMDYLAAKRAKI